MDVFVIALVGPRQAAADCAAALDVAGWPARVDEDGPGNSGVDNLDPGYLTELADAGFPFDVRVVEVAADTDGALAEVQTIGKRFGFWLRLHGWVMGSSAVQPLRETGPPLSVEQTIADMSPEQRRRIGKILQNQGIN